jgi:hypothetical protein
MIRGLWNTLTDPLIRREWRFNTVRKFAGWLLPDYRFQLPEVSWLHDAAFNAYLKRFNLLGSTNCDRRWTLSELTKLAQTVLGDTAECGVMGGASSFLISRAFPNRQHFAFDSFAGLSQPGVGEEFWTAGTMACTLDRARANLADCPNVRFLKGWIPQRFNEVADKRFCFVHIDVQLFQPTDDSLRFFYPRLNPGGVIVSDDYGYAPCVGAIRAFDQFLADKPEKMITLSSGSAFLIKGLHGSSTENLTR